MMLRLVIGQNRTKHHTKCYHKQTAKAEGWRVGSTTQTTHWVLFFGSAGERMQSTTQLLWRRLEAQDHQHMLIVAEPSIKG